MSNNRTSALRVALFVLLWGMISVPALAQSPAAAPPAPTVSTEGAPTVTGIIIDKTDKNAVVARDQAIVEAQRTAFQTLAAKFMSPDQLKTFKAPDDKTIAGLVQDFEIKNEQISATRYVASFTVRFTPEVSNYIKITGDSSNVVASVHPPESAAEAPAPKPAPAATVAEGPQNILVLPYYEDISGKKILWEDPNPWREAWQASGNSTPAPGITVTVPLGDLADLSSGNSDVVWSGDYSVLEKLRTNYAATEIALTVANKSGVHMKVDLYIYKNGKLDHMKSITPYNTGTENDTDSFKQIVAQVISVIQSPESLDGSKAVAEAPADTQASPEAEKPAEPAQPEKVTLEATLPFDSFTQWLEAQRRMASISPPLNVEISSISKNAARFTIAYDGGLDALKTALAGKGLALNEPVVEVDESVLGSAKPTQHSLYELRLLN